MTTMQFDKTIVEERAFISYPAVGSERAEMRNMEVRNTAAQNLSIKAAMARELKMMGLSEKSISRVLNVEPCDLEKPSTKER